MVPGWYGMASVKWLTRIRVLTAPFSGPYVGVEFGLDNYEVQAEERITELEQLMGDPDGLLRESSRMLSRLSNLLGVVLSPRLSDGVLE